MEKKNEKYMDRLTSYEECWVLEQFPHAWQYRERAAALRDLELKNDAVLEIMYLGPPRKSRGH